ncbi:MAG: hypothetical protein LC777_19850 [Actinobacteria bacterium]|nr:hypothetical protein [Actinomycetota bacterium]
MSILDVIWGHRMRDSFLMAWEVWWALAPVITDESDGRCRNPKVPWLLPMGRSLADDATRPACC